MIYRQPKEATTFPEDVMLTRLAPEPEIWFHTTHPWPGLMPREVDPKLHDKSTAEPSGAWRVDVLQEAWQCLFPKGGVLGLDGYQAHIKNIEM